MAAKRTVTTVGGNRYRLGRELGRGGQGAVFAVEGQLLAVKLLRDHASPHEGARWQLHGLDAGPGFAAALATRGTPSRLVTLDWKALRST